MTWEEMVISQTPIDVSNIIIEPSNTAMNFLIYGETVSNGKNRGVAVNLDFSSLHQSECKNIENPGDSESDYELWSPNGAISPNCLMGKKVTYARKKRESKCFNPQIFEKRIKVE